MAVRTDIFTVDWSLSPRIIDIAIAFDEVSAQDLYDTLRYYEEQTDGIDEPQICDAGGWEPLGLGKFVGITVSLFNAKYKFADRPGPDWVICNMTGGNVVGFTDDSKTTTLYPREPSAYVSADRTASASATTQELTAIQYSAYNNQVVVDIVNGLPGTLYPQGTYPYPVDNIADALTIVSNQQLPPKMFILESMTLGVDATLANYILEGRNHVETEVTILDSANVNKVTFEALNVNGVLDGESVIRYCVVGTITYLNGHIHNSAIDGIITLGGSEDAYIVNCSQLDMNVEPEINMGGSGQDLVMPDYTGILHIRNMTANKAGIGLAGGRVILHSDTVTGGFVHVSGNGSLLDENGDHIPTGTWNGVTVVNETDGYQFWLIQQELIQVLTMSVNKVVMSGDIATVYEADGNTVWRQYDLSNGGRVEV